MNTLLFLIFVTSIACLFLTIFKPDLFNPFVKKLKISKTTLKILCLVTIVLSLGLFVGTNDETAPSDMLSDTQESNSKTTTPEAKPTEIETVQQTNDQIKIQLQQELDTYDQNFVSAINRESVAELTLEVTLFHTWGEMIKQNKNNPDKEIQSLTSQLEKKISELQIKEFPLIRKTYGEIIGKKLWEENFEIRILGAGNKTIELINVIFANNKNIAELHEAITNNLKDFRFDEVNYKWYKYDDDYAHFDIDSKEDAEVVGIDMN